MSVEARKINQNMGLEILFLYLAHCFPGIGFNDSQKEKKEEELKKESHSVPGIIGEQSSYQGISRFIGRNYGYPEGHYPPPQPIYVADGGFSPP